MPSDDLPRDPRDASPLTPGWRSMVAVAAFYLACLAVATWPAFATFGSTLPSRVDPLAHLWTMRWNKACLLEGKLPFVCPDIQYPVGASLGTLPPMHFQTLLYVPLSAVIPNDVACYNIIRTFAFVLTGLGTFVLIWVVVGSRPAATLGGLAAMLGTPMTFFSRGELEQITVGWFPLFLVAWLRWVDRPSGRGLAAAAGLYALVAMSAPYFGVFAVFPATLYVVWRMIAAGRGGAWPWLRARLGWFSAFAGIAAPVLVVLFANQIWALTHGFSMARPDAEFAMCRAPFWGYFVPSPAHWLGRHLPFDANIAAELGSVPSYLGLVPLALIAYAAACRVRFARGSYWWAALALLVILSMGAHGRVGTWDVSLPAAWLKKYFVGFRMIRVPARFNLFASVAAAVVAAAGLRHLLARMPGPQARAAAFGALLALTLVDLSTTPYATITVPPMPACYEVIRGRDPAATFLEVPQFNSGAFQLASAATYWQSLHGGKTSAGYTAFANGAYDNRLFFNSPFDAFKLAQPWYLTGPGPSSFEFARGLDFRSYVWLYLTVHDLRYVVVHHGPGSFPEFAVDLGKVESRLQESKIHEDDATAVFDRERMPKPTHPVFLYTNGWGNRVDRDGRWTCMVGRHARVFVYNPTPDIPLTLTLDAASNKATRTVALRGLDQDLGLWQVPPRSTSLLASPPFRLPEGITPLVLASDGEDKPSRTAVRVEGDATPFSLWVSGIHLDAATPQAVAGRRMERIAR